MKRILTALLLGALLTQTALAAGIETISELGTALELNKNKVHIIKRSEWGADESIRFYKERIENPKVIELSKEIREKFADELKIRKTITKQDGKTLIWPLQYAEKITKFIIHHTATDVREDEPAQTVNDIYHSHAIGRGWGDIGYNYLIDREGNIYEGRYGGEGVVGGHATIGNIGSIGIAVLGTYSEDKVPKKVVSSLIRLIAEKAKIHNIDPDGYSLFRGKISPNVIGDRDVRATECPGEKLEALLPIIRVLAARLAGTTTVSEINRFRSITGYDYEDKSGITYIEMQPTQAGEITIRLENTGEKPWGTNTFLIVNRNPDFENVVNFPEKKGAVLAHMEEKNVNPGQTATFKVKIRTELKPDLVYLNFAPVIDGKKKISKYLVLPLLVANADYSYDIGNSRLPPPFMKAGRKFEGFLDIKNNGNVIWPGKGKNRVTLGADHERDRISKLADPEGTRLGYLMQKEVKPGETGRFLLRLKAPDKKGFYQEYFTPVMEGITWFDDRETSFRTFVYEKKYDSQLKEAIPYKKIKIGETKTMWIKLLNMGGVAWKKEDFSAAVFSGRLKVTNMKLEEDEVVPGEAGTITFSVGAADKMGMEVIHIRPRIKNHNIYRGMIKFPVRTVKNAETKNRKGGNIRVKISFGGDKPLISADGRFSIYRNGQKIKTLEAGQYEEIDYDKNDIYRFVPEGRAIMEIVNFENSPAWNPDLNDNRYRGVLEVKNGLVINELPLEDYLKGLAENANDEPYEKIKALVVLARTYALYYMTQDEKFPGEPYHLDDTPQNSQKYLGYGYELRSPNNAKAVMATRGRVVKYNGRIVKTPYFSQSDGRTRSAEEVWGWTDTPYLAGVDDPFCEGLALKGHGVGMSGCGARAMAASGKKYKEIIRYYFKNVVITKVY